MSIGLRERKKQRQREAIVEAAVALFRERGFDETRVQDILERAEISLRTFYNYFPGKDAVLDDYGASVIASYVELAREELEAQNQSVADRVRALAAACGRGFSADADFMTVVVTESRAFTGRGQLPEPDQPIYGLLSLLFEEGQASGEIRRDVPAIELAQTFSGIFMITVIGWLTERKPGRRASRREGERELEHRLMRAYDVFLDGCRTPTAKRPSANRHRGSH